MSNEQAELKKRFDNNPCRGIVLGAGIEGSMRQFAWIMGRSPNSQNRVYEPNVEGADLRTAPADPSKVEDPRLIIYNVMRHSGSSLHVVSNGDQTDDVAEYGYHSVSVDSGGFDDFSYALRRRHCEPDAPTFTPRITGIQNRGASVVYLALLRPDFDEQAHWIEVEKASGLTKDQFRKEGMKESEVTEAYNQAIGKLARLDHQRFPTIRSFFEFPFRTGIGYCLTTYKPGSLPEGKELLSFDGEPFAVPIVGTLDESVMNLWNHLDDCGDKHWRVAIAGIEIAPNGRYKMFVHNTRQKV
ncbi:IMP cyclohydrolase-like protein [uncultured archaeon]|nr:IMP cyclohydrolase-like protein [uncultured archaeon]